jgi:heme O synthase-like polyprenyltransferase
MTKAGALTFACATGSIGTAILFLGVNTYSAILAFSNIILYAIVCE